VLCRVRPVIPEDGSTANTVVSFDRDDDSLVFVERNKQKLSFECDRVFNMNSSQEEVSNFCRLDLWLLVLSHIVLH